MAKPRDITSEVLVPKPVKNNNTDSSFFIGQVALDTQPDTTEIEVKPLNKIKQRHLDNSKIIDTPWKEIKDVY
jgi:hypothetical protein|tara:strand:+ start:75 stop:293 length:219 start_codon:yes stop_codon:yes gene_type:complete